MRAICRADDDTPMFADAFSPAAADAAAYAIRATYTACADVDSSLRFDCRRLSFLMPMLLMRFSPSHIAAFSFLIFFFDA